MSTKESQLLDAFLSERDRLWREYVDVVRMEGTALYSPHITDEEYDALEKSSQAARAALEAHGAKVVDA